jgi:hypothetical protein
MRKLILLALAIGAAELLKRRSAQLGITPSAVLAGLIERALNWFQGETQEANARRRPDVEA